MALWSIWQISTAAGILAGALIPESWPLTFFIPLTFIALVVPNLEDWPTALAALSGGVVSILAFDLPFRLGLIVASFVGIAVGMLVESVRPISLDKQSDQEHL